MSLADADVVVADGAGCGAANWHLVEELDAALLTVLDLNWRPWIRRGAHRQPAWASISVAMARALQRACSNENASERTELRAWEKRAGLNTEIAEFMAETLPPAGHAH